MNIKEWLEDTWYRFKYSIIVGVVLISLVLFIGTKIEVEVDAQTTDDVQALQQLPEGVSDPAEVQEDSVPPLPEVQ